MEFERMLTKGALKAMIHNENPHEFVVQIFSIKLFNSNEQKRCFGIISDGINLHSFCMLSSNLNELIFSGKLESFCIVKIKKYVITSVIDYFKCRKTLTIKDIVMLIPGKDVGSIIGNPQPITELFFMRSNLEKPVIIPGDFKNCLTKGSIMSIMNNVEIKNPIFQVFDFGVLNLRTRGIYRLAISDGDHYISITAVGTLVDKIVSGQLSEFAIIGIGRYIINDYFYYPEKPVKCLTILDFQILVSNKIVGRKLGNPKQINEKVWNTVDNNALNIIDCFDNVNLN